MKDQERQNNEFSFMKFRYTKISNNIINVWILYIVIV